MNGIGEHLFRNGDLKGAVEVFSQAVGFAPDFIDACNNLAVCFVSAGDYGRAKEVLNRALQINPLDRDSVFNTAELHLKMGTLQEALPPLRDYLAKYPSDTEIRNKLYEIEAKMADLET